MLETHPFSHFAPPNAKFLILGSFTGRQAVQGSDVYIPKYDWYYGTPRNQFWPILEEIYSTELDSKVAKQALFSLLGIAIADIILQCERKAGTNSDANLKNIVYNTDTITEILNTNPIEKIFFTSRFVENKFKRHFKASINRRPNAALIYLPSPSPRNARMTLIEKTNTYKALLPRIRVSPEG